MENFKGCQNTKWDIKTKFVQEVKVEPSILVNVTGWTDEEIEQLTNDVNKSIMTDNKLRSYLEWLITPQNEDEQDLFKSENLVDDYIVLKQKIPSLSRSELIKEINIQLAPYSLEINER